MGEQLGDELPADGSREGAVYYRPLSDGNDICIYRMLGSWKVCLSVQGSLGIERYYEYVSLSRAVAAAATWTSGSEPLDGWGWARSSESRCHERDFERPEGGPPSDHLISFATVKRLGAHDRVRVWNRGGLAGELVVVAGDGERIAQAHGLVERT